MNIMNNFILVGVLCMVSTLACSEDLTTITYPDYATVIDSQPNYITIPEYVVCTDNPNTKKYTETSPSKGLIGGALEQVVVQPPRDCKTVPESSVMAGYKVTIDYQGTTKILTYPTNLEPGSALRVNVKTSQ
jgi:hypothetical protein